MKGMMKEVEILNGKKVNGGESEDTYRATKIIYKICTLLTNGSCWQIDELASSFSAGHGFESLKLHNC